MTEIRVKLADGGRIAIPAEYRAAMDLRAGDELLLRLEAGEVRIIPLRRDTDTPLPETPHP